MADLVSGRVVARTLNPSAPMVQRNVPRKVALDVACGTGQSSRLFGKYFEEVIGCDVSGTQITEAQNTEKIPNITYKVAPADKLPTERESVSLVTVFQAIHWFDQQQFFQEAERVLVPGGCLCVCGYAAPLLSYKDKSEKLTDIVNTVRTCSVCL
uniref:Methyltransferase DDB_G0268948-like n=1 Tax=Saccoglossus kowalevskii TaxID=10224 RepID=A0ABM0MQ62_SACKO|nr:PREDICTED: putative methyltransferase DDB_G0268948-like [Saccoglossus kowalevskii]